MTKNKHLALIIEPPIGSVVIYFIPQDWHEDTVGWETVSHRDSEGEWYTVGGEGLSDSWEWIVKQKNLRIVHVPEGEK